MRQSWLEPVLDPSDLIRRGRGRRTTLRDGVAYLLDGRLADYARKVEEHGLPQFGVRWDRSANPDWGFLATITRHLSGEPDAPIDYEAVAGDQRANPSLQAAATVLAAIAWSDAGEDDRALAILARALETGEGVERCWLLVHTAARLADRGDATAAVSRIAEANALGRDLPRDQISDTLQVVIAHNDFVLRFATGEIRDPETLPSRAKARPLTHIEGLLADGLEHYLRGQFEAAYRDPYERSITWRSQDPVESPLFGALLQSECWADHFALQRSRKVVGWYRLLSAAGVTHRQPEAGFQLLRRARDKNGIRKAVGLYRRVGPELPLRNLGEQAAASVWLVSEEEATLELLRGVAEFLTEDTAAALVERLLRDEGLHSRSAPSLLDALAQVVQVAGTRVQDEVAKRTLSWVRATGHPLVALSAGHVLRGLDWTAVSTQTRRDWLDFVATHLTDSSDAGSLAETAAIALVDVAQRNVRRILLSAYRKLPTLGLAALIADADAGIDPGTATQLKSQLVEALQSVRDDAQKGRYSGLTIDIAMLCTWLLKRQSDAKTWSALAEFILDPKVAASQKASAMDSLASPGTRIPATITRVLTEQLPSSTAYAGPLFGPREAFEGARLRLGLKLNLFTDDNAMAMLLTMSRGTPAARVEALRTIESARSREASELVATLTISLAGEENPDVAAHAARVLGILAGRVSRPIADVMYHSLEVALQNPGSVVRRGALEGLQQASKNSRLYTAEIRRTVVRMAESDVSAAVRFAARRVMDRYSE
jgi:hypothetical protein